MTRHLHPGVADVLELEINGLAVTATVPERLRWTDARRGEELVTDRLQLVELVRAAADHAAALWEPAAA